MNNSPPDAAWDENDSRHFIDYGAYFVPEREVQNGHDLQRYSRTGTGQHSGRNL
jgi:hypothetical protein